MKAYPTPAVVASGLVLTISLLAGTAHAAPAKAAPAPNPAKTTAAQADRLSADGNFGQAFTTAEKAVALARAMKPADPDTLATALTAGCTHAAPIDIQKSLTYCEEALTASEAAYGPDDTRTLSARSSVAQLYTVFGRLAEAEGLYSRIIDPMERRAASLDENGRRELASNYCFRAVTRFSLGRWQESEADYMVGIDRLKAMPVKVAVGDLTTCETWLADRYTRWGRYEEARRMLADTLALRDANFPANHPNTADTLGVYGDLLTRMGRYDEAEPLLRRMLEIAETADTPSKPIVARGLQNLGRLYLATGRIDEARPLLERGAETFLSIGDAGRGAAATVYFDLAKAYYDAGRPGDGLPYADKAIELTRAAANAPGNDADILVLKARLDFGRGAPADGLAHAQEAVAIFRKLGVGGPRMGAALAASAEGAALTGDHPGALALSREAVALLDKGGLGKRSQALILADYAREVMASGGAPEEAWKAGSEGAQALTADLIAVSRSPGQRGSVTGNAEIRGVYQTAVEAGWAYGETLKPAH